MPYKKTADKLSEITVYRHSRDSYAMHECPQCHRHSLLQANTRFRCLSCDFYRDLAFSKRDSADTTEGNWMFAIAIAVVLVLLLLNS